MSIRVLIGKVHTINISKYVYELHISIKYSVCFIHILFYILYQIRQCTLGRQLPTSCESLITSQKLEHGPEQKLPSTAEPTGTLRRDPRAPYV